jgi:hypothetical protein
MPYNLPFERITKLSNESAFEQNKSVAVKLIAAFPEVHDLNQASSNAHFMQRELDVEDDFPEKHFSLYADIGDMGFSFDFWKDVLWLELGTAGDVDARFVQVRRYAAFIMQLGLFKINLSPDAEAMTIDEGIAWHLREYKQWAGLVDHVVKLVAPKPPTT